MKRLIPILALSAIGLSLTIAAQNPVTLSFYSSGDVNVKNLWEQNLLPMYQRENPNVKFELIFSQSGTGNQATLDRMAAAKKAGQASRVLICSRDPFWKLARLDCCNRLNP